MMATEGSLQANVDATSSIATCLVTGWPFLRKAGVATDKAEGPDEINAHVQKRRQVSICATSDHVTSGMYFDAHDKEICS